MSSKQLQAQTFGQDICHHGRSRTPNHFQTSRILNPLLQIANRYIQMSNPTAQTSIQQHCFGRRTISAEHQLHFAIRKLLNQSCNPFTLLNCSKNRSQLSFTRAEGYTTLNSRNPFDQTTSVKNGNSRYRSSTQRRLRCPTRIRIDVNPSWSCIWDFTPRPIILPAEGTGFSRTESPASTHVQNTL